MGRKQQLKVEGLDLMTPEFVIKNVGELSDPQLSEAENHALLSRNYWVKEKKRAEEALASFDATLKAIRSEQDFRAEGPVEYVSE